MEARHLAVLAFFVAALAAGVSAQETGENVDTVIMASTENYPDALVGAAAASKIGSPILLTDKNQIPQDTQDSLQSLGPKEVVLIGGPAVASDSVQSSLAEDYNVTRLWGTTRYGTAVEVAGHFWVEGADEAVLVQNGLQERNGTVIAAAKDLAREGESPLYLTPEGSVPAVVLTSLQNLGVGEVTVVGTEVSDSYRNSLNEIGVTVEEEITGETDREVKERIQNITHEDINASQELLAVASKGFRHQIAAANLPNTDTFHVTSEEDIGELVSLVQEENISSVKVAGKPSLAEDAAEALREDTDARVRLVVARAAEAVSMNANLTEDNVPEFVDASRRGLADWEERRQRLQENVETRANESLQKAQNLVDENASEEAREALREAETLFSAGKYVESHEESMRAISEVREARYESERDDPEKLRKRVREETADLEERTEELGELNREFGEEMRENMTVEERLETIEEFRDEREETVKKLMEEAQKSRGEIDKRFRQAREGIRERKRHRTGDKEFEAEIECTEEQTTNLTIEGKDGRVHVEGDVGLSTPKYRPSNTVNVDTENKEVDVTISFQKREGFGVQCVANAEVENRVYVGAGNWTVSLSVTVEGGEKVSKSSTVQVTAEGEGEVGEEEGEKEMENESEEPVERTSASPDRTVTLTNYEYSDTAVEVDKGTVVRFTNNEGTHTVTLASVGIDREVSPGESVTLKFNEKGTYEVYCRFHGSPGENMHSDIGVATSVSTADSGGGY